MTLELKNRIENRMRRFLIKNDVIVIGQTAEGYAIIWLDDAFTIVDPETGKIISKIQ